jgi:diguanylate cyclase (GGDEF)-like protein
MIPHHIDTPGVLPGAGYRSRGQLIAALDAILAEAASGAHSVALLVMAIDRFDTLNEIHGFEAGDEILAAMADRLRTTTGESALIGRLAGDTLGIVVPAASPAAMAAAAERLHAAVRNEILATSAGFIAATVSSGGVLLPGHGRSAAEAIARAREALHLARRQGTGHFVAYSPSPLRRAEQIANAALSADLMAALSERRVSLALQPVVDIDTRRPLFHEALVRIDRPGEPAAAGLAAFAERLGLIRMVDRMVLDLALGMLGEDNGPLSVNISAHTIGDVEWIDRLLGAVAARPGLARNLIVELTETAMVGNLDEAAAFVGRLHEAGCRVAIDDFGAGYTSFRILRELDVDIVKIDGSYIENLAGNRADQVFVRGLADLATSFGVGIVAEWVQDEASAAILKDLGVDAIQGHLTGDPFLP